MIMINDLLKEIIIIMVLLICSQIMRLLHIEKYVCNNRFRLS